MITSFDRSPSRRSSPSSRLGRTVSLLVMLLVSRPASATTQPAVLLPLDPGPRWRVFSPPAASAPSVRLVVPQSSPAPPSRTLTVEVAQPGAAPTAAVLPSADTDTTPADAQAVASAPLERPYLLSPSLSGGVPSGYVGGWGDYFVAGSAGTPGRLRGGQPDGSLNLGFGLGDPIRSLGFDVNWGIGSIKNFNGNGSVGVSAGRILVNRPDLQIGVAAGLLDAYVYGNEPGQPATNGYGAVSVTLPLRPSDPRFQQRLQLTAGGGGSSFAAIDANFQTTEAGFFVAAGVEITPALGLSIGQSSRSTNLNLAYIPFRSLPVFVNLVAADLFSVTPFGTVGVLSVGWGDSLQRGFLRD